MKLSECGDGVDGRMLAGGGCVKKKRREGFLEGGMEGGRFG